MPSRRNRAPESAPSEAHQPAPTLPRQRASDGEPIMRQSHIVEIDGAFVGAAVREADGYRFVAVDVRLDDIDGRVWHSLPELQRQVRVMVLAARGPGRSAPAASCLV
jgi:hypothetical protein